MLEHSDEEKELTLIGDKMAIFYESLCAYATHKHRNHAELTRSVILITLISSLCNLETHWPPVSNAGETDKINIEIVEDCRKKFVNAVRPSFAETIRPVISAVRKRLALKTSLEVGAETLQLHSQRHFNSMVEILGSWSNILNEVVSFQLSAPVTKMLLSPLYTRILEAAVECYTSFHKDRELDKWSRKVLEKDAMATISLKSLDFLLSQVASMRELVHKHYAYTHFVLSPVVLREKETQRVTTTTTTATTTANATTIHNDELEEFLIVTAEEMNTWRELDAVYIMLEFAYMLQALNLALCEHSLLEVETLAYVPQAVEDIFFLFHRISQRAVSTGSEHCVFAIGNKIVELLKIPETENESFNMGGDDSDIFHRWLSSGVTFKSCVKNGHVSTATIDSLLIRSGLQLSSGPVRLPGVVIKDSNGSSDLVVSSPPTSSGGVRGGAGGEDPVTELAAEFSAAVEIANGVSGIISKGVNNFFGGFSSPYFGTGDAPLSDHGQRPTLASIDSSRKTSTTSLNELLMSALELDEKSETAASIKIPSNRDDEVRLSLELEDIFVQLNAISVVVQSINSLIFMFEDSSEILVFRTASTKRAKQSSSEILLTELQHCRDSYSSFLCSKMRSLCTCMYEETVKGVMERHYRNESFNITGDEMDSRSEDRRLFKAVQHCVDYVLQREECLDRGKVSTEAIMSKLSHVSFCTFLCEMQKLLSQEIILNMIVTNQFSEWGAILLCEEVRSIVRYMESLIEDLYFLDVFKDICEDLNIALKILTADSPAEVKGYSSLPSCSGLSKVDESAVQWNECLIRKIMGARVEFSKEVVSKIKIFN